MLKQLADVAPTTRCGRPFKWKMTHRLKMFFRTRVWIVNCEWKFHIMSSEQINSSWWLKNADRLTFFQSLSWHLYTLIRSPKILHVGISSRENTCPTSQVVQHKIHCTAVHRIILVVLLWTFSRHCAFCNVETYTVISYLFAVIYCAALCVINWLIDWK